jgi:UTP-glucose-1-phosphate uridylyltransferase
MIPKVRKAVFPATGTRFLPATKAQPREMLPLVDKPLIQYGVEEAIHSGKFEGKRYDAGDKLGFLKATVEFALNRHDLGGEFREYLRGLKL